MTANPCPRSENTTPPPEAPVDEDSFGRIAIVGDAKWEEWGTRLSDPLFRAEMKFFESSQHQVAESWVRSGEDTA